LNKKKKEKKGLFRDDDTKSGNDHQAPGKEKKNLTHTIPPIRKERKKKNCHINRKMAENDSSAVGE